MSNLRPIKGDRLTQERAGKLAASIRALCFAEAEGMSIAAVVGVLEIVKFELMRDT